MFRWPSNPFGSRSIVALAAAMALITTACSGGDATAPTSADTTATDTTATDTTASGNADTTASGNTDTTASGNTEAEDGDADTGNTDPESNTDTDGADNADDGEKPVAEGDEPPRQPGVQAQQGDANDAYGGGGPTTCPIFPADNWWNQEISDLPVHARSQSWVASIGSGNLHPDFGTVWDGKAIGIPYVVVDDASATVPVSFTYAQESEPGPYPIPPNAPIEDGSDRHVIVIDNTDCVLYELFDATPIAGGSSWDATSGAVFDLRSNQLREAGWTSADAAGLPIYPGLVTYDEVVVEGRIDHALRFTVARTQQAYIRPATHFASSDTNPDLAPMGARFRLRADFDCGSFSDEIKVVCAALKTYGMFVADNGTSWHVSGAPDPRWNDTAMADLRQIPGSAFEAVDTGEPITCGTGAC